MSLNPEHSHFVATTLQETAWAEAANNEAFHAERMRPSMLLRPSLSIHGDRWRAAYGSLPGLDVVGYGDSPAEAFKDFDREWVKKLLPRRKAVL